MDCSKAFVLGFQAATVFFCLLYLIYTKWESLKIFRYRVAGFTVIKLTIKNGVDSGVTFWSFIRKDVLTKDGTLSTWRYPSGIGEIVLQPDGTAKYCGMDVVWEIV